MPPSAVKTVRDLMYWQYAKIIAGSSIHDKKSFGYVMDKFKKLQQEEIFWNEIREYVKEREQPNECILCGKKTSSLTLDHLFPQSLNGPNDEKNIIWICPQCNSSKGAKRLYEFWTTNHGLKAAKYDVPRIAEGKYLKFLYEIFQHNNLLTVSKDDLKQKICPHCDLRKLCEHEKSEYKLSPLCLDGIATIILNK